MPTNFQFTGNPKPAMYQPRGLEYFSYLPMLKAQVKAAALQKATSLSMDLTGLAPKDMESAQELTSTVTNSKNKIVDDLLNGEKVTDSMVNQLVRLGENKKTLDQRLMYAKENAIKREQLHNTINQKFMGTEYALYGQRLLEETDKNWKGSFAPNPEEAEYKLYDAPAPVAIVQKSKEALQNAASNFTEKEREYISAGKIRIMGVDTPEGKRFMMTYDDPQITKENAPALIRTLEEINQTFFGTPDEDGNVTESNATKFLKFMNDEDYLRGISSEINLYANSLMRDIKEKSGENISVINPTKAETTTVKKDPYKLEYTPRYITDLYNSPLSSGLSENVPILKKDESLLDAAGRVIRNIGMRTDVGKPDATEFTNEEVAEANSKASKLYDYAFGEEANERLINLFFSEAPQDVNVKLSDPNNPFFSNELALSIAKDFQTSKQGVYTPGLDDLKDSFQDLSEYFKKNNIELTKENLLYSTGDSRELIELKNNFNRKMVGYIDETPATATRYGYKNNTRQPLLLNELKLVTLTPTSTGGVSTSDVSKAFVRDVISGLNNKGAYTFTVNQEESNDGTRTRGQIKDVKSYADNKDNISGSLAASLEDDTKLLGHSFYTIPRGSELPSLLGIDPKERSKYYGATVVEGTTTAQGVTTYYVVPSNGSSFYTDVRQGLSTLAPATNTKELRENLTDIDLMVSNIRPGEKQTAYYIPYNTSPTENGFSKDQYIEYEIGYVNGSLQLSITDKDILEAVNSKTPLKYTFNTKTALIEGFEQIMSNYNE